MRAVRCMDRVGGRLLAMATYLQHRVVGVTSASRGQRCAGAHYTDAERVGSHCSRDTAPAAGAVDVRRWQCGSPLVPGQFVN